MTVGAVVVDCDSLTSVADGLVALAGELGLRYESLARDLHDIAMDLYDEVAREYAANGITTTDIRRSYE